MQELIVAIVSSAAVVLAALAGAPGLGRNPRTQVLKDIEIYKALPDSSSAKRQQLSLIEKQIDNLAKSLDGERSPMEIVLGVIILILAFIVIMPMVTWGGWWWLLSPLALFLLLLGGVGLGQGLTKGSRNEKG